VVGAGYNKGMMMMMLSGLVVSKPCILRFGKN